MVPRADVQKARHTRAGFLMRAYREGFVDENGRRGLSQEELLRRMAALTSGLPWEMTWMMMWRQSPWRKMSLLRLYQPRMPAA